MYLLAQAHDRTVEQIQYHAVQLDGFACQALLDEVSLEHKPGLVCPQSQGSHTDMDYAVFQRSIMALNGYFQAQCVNGFQRASFEDIRQCGVHAELNMMAATAQINTHKGAIFNLGFASAAVGRCLAENRPVYASDIGQVLKESWQNELLHHLQRNPNSHGQRMRSQYGITGAIEEVASGFKTVFDVALPAYSDTYAKTENKNMASMQALFSLMASVQDTNIVWRGGMSALLIVQDMAKQFLAQGGVLQQHWLQQVQIIADYFVQHRLSPGGSADLLGVTLFLNQVEHEFRNIL